MQNFTQSFDTIYETKYDYDFPLTIENLLDKYIEFRLNGFQILIISTLFFMITICFPLRRNISRILELEESNANQKEIIENYQNKVQAILDKDPCISVKASQ